jgi:hypothetical protein
MSNARNVTAGSSTKERTPLHRRNIELQGYRRSDGLYDIEGELLDVKHYDYVNSDGNTRFAGQPLHRMKVRLTVDASMTLREIDAGMLATPFAECHGGVATLDSLIGTSLSAGWRQAIDRVAGRTAGCTHVRELLAAMATAAFQTVTHDLSVQRQARGEPLYPSDNPPPMFGQCIAWDFDGPVVKRVAPQFYGYRVPSAK